MSSYKEYPNDKRPVVLLFSEANCLAIYLLENLLANHCIVKIFTEDIRCWKERTTHIQTKDFIEFRKVNNRRDVVRGDYALFINIDRGFDKKYLKETILYSEKNQIKTFAVYSYKDVEDVDLNAKLPDTIGVVLVGDFIGPRIDLIESNPITKLLVDVYRDKKLNIKSGELLCPVYVGDVSRLLTKWLFSFGPYGEVTPVLSKEISILEIANIVYRKLKGEDTGLFDIRVNDSPQDVKIINITQNPNRINIRTDINRMLDETVEWFLKYGRYNIEKSKKKPLPKIEKKKSLAKSKSLMICLLFFIFLFPLLLLLVSPLSLLQAKRLIEEGKLDAGKQFFEISATTSQLAESQFILYSKIPLLGNIYSQGVGVARSLGRISSIAIEGTFLLKESSALAINALEGKSYDVVDYSKKLTLRLNSIFENMSFLESEMETTDSPWERILLNTLQTYGLKDIGDIKSLILSCKLILEELPYIMGADKKQTYLVLLQNNMELRPTGGFIGSFALVTLDKGKVSDITIQDVYSADGQMKGYVKPPDPIRDYLNEESWFLRDSNWDPDFPTSASRAEWFLDKEIDVSVDGVFSIDLEPVKDLLAVYGPLLLSDYNVTLDENNFYEKTQTETEKDFFPGSYRKSGFMTAIAKSLTEKLIAPNDKATIMVLKILYENLNQKHIQIFLHEKKIQSIISDMGWDGSVNYPNCSGNCYSDWFGLVEANLGVNKANYYINRSYSLEVFLTSGMSVKKSLITKYNNRANPELGPAAVYKTYTRLLVSPDSDIGGIYVANGESKETLKYDTFLVNGRKEIGFFMEIPPGGERLLYIDWESATELKNVAGGQYGIVWRKQSGAGDDQVKISFDFGLLGDYRLEQDRSLTFDGKDSYNTLLSRDLVSRIFW